MSYPKNTHHLLCLIDKKDNAVGLEYVMPKLLAQMLGLGGDAAAVRKVLKRIDRFVNSLEPTNRVTRRAFVNVRE